MIINDLKSSLKYTLRSIAAQKLWLLYYIYKKYRYVLKAYGEPSNLWLDFTQGNRKSFTTIYNTHVARLFEYGMRILKDEDHTRDCIHDLFTKLWANRKTLGQTDNERLYLLGALRNTIMAYKAKEDRFMKVELKPDDFIIEFNAESIHIQNDEALAQSQKIRMALEQLTGRQKEIIYLKYFEEMDYEQISELMNISVKGAYKLSARALEALKVILDVDAAVVIVMLFQYRSQLF
jgi:RNA polymerase sigma factor (sigma-70 family)